MEELNLTSTDIIGFCAAILTTLAFLPQLIRTWKTKCAKDVSIYTLLLFTIGVAIWIEYGFLAHSIPVIIANIVTCILNLWILVLKLYYEQFKLKDIPNE
mgnify:CR=1 FL=1